MLYFHKVVPKKQYLTVLKKEYDFGKGHEAVEIGQSEHVVKEITGQRISFSAYGTLKSLSGQAISKGIVVARHEDSAEQANVQEDGTFRVMGLQPGKTYLFCAMSDSMSRLFPSNLPITIA